MRKLLEAMDAANSPLRPTQGVSKKTIPNRKAPSIIRDLKSVADDKSLEWKLEEEYTKFKQLYELGATPVAATPSAPTKTAPVKPVGATTTAPTANVAATGATTSNVKPVGTTPTTPAGATPAVDQVQAKNVAAATSTLKAATSNPAAPTAIAKAINNASTGAAVNAQDMKALAPMMGLVGQAAQDPKLANQFKSFASQAKQAIQK